MWKANTDDKIIRGFTFIINERRLKTIFFHEVWFRENVVGASENIKRVGDHWHLEPGLVAHAPYRPNRERRCPGAVHSFTRLSGSFSVGQRGNLKATQVIRNKYSATERRIRVDRVPRRSHRTKIHHDMTETPVDSVTVRSRPWRTSSIRKVRER